MYSPLISNCLGKLQLIAMNGANRSVGGFTPGISDIVISDDQNAVYTIQSVDWDSNTNIGTILFTSPTVTLASNRTINIKVNNKTITTLPSPLKINILPPFAGKSFLDNAWLAWDMTLVAGGSPQIVDYSGGNNNAVNKSGVNLVGTLGGGTGVQYSKTVSGTLGRTIWSITTNYTTGSNAVLNSSSLVKFNNGWPFRTISTVVYTGFYYCTSGVYVDIWTYRFTDENDNTYQWRLKYNYNTSTSVVGISLVLTLNGVDHDLMDNAPVDTNIMFRMALNLITVVFNDDGSGSVYINGSLFNTIANMWFTTPPLNDGVTSTLNYFAAMGDTNINLGQTNSFGQLELITYTVPLTATQVAINSAAWGFPG